MNFQDIANLVFGGEIGGFGGVTADELVDTFTTDEFDQAGEFIEQYDTQLRRWGGIPFPGDISEYDAIQHPGKNVLERMVERWD